MSLKGTKRHWICMRICTMVSPSRPSSINVPMYAWSKQWKTGNRETTERRVRRGALNEYGMDHRPTDLMRNPKDMRCPCSVHSCSHISGAQTHDRYWGKLTSNPC